MKSRTQKSDICCWLMSIIKIVDADDPKENDAANNERRKPRRENVTHTHTPMSHVTVAV